MTFKFPFKKRQSDFSDLPDTKDPEYEFCTAINLFTSQRKKLGISLEELSNKTKISRNVLIAIENGWEKYLPEATYLISMIKRIELELNLKKGSLSGLTAQKITINKLSSLKLNFINIDFLNNWIGSLLYLLIMFLSILALNSQQRYLLKINSLSTEPVRIDAATNENKKKH
tara:strand:- start:955 stop:1470 length:516 start_codon:yes stop_codon:yes gene_type:complete